MTPIPGLMLSLVFASLALTAVFWPSRPGRLLAGAALVFALLLFAVVMTLMTRHAM